jgi:hypothetical protein
MGTTESQKVTQIRGSETQSTLNTHQKLVTKQKRRTGHWLRVKLTYG